jgi:hypothetical protein
MAALRSVESMYVVQPFGPLVVAQIGMPRPFHRTVVLVWNPLTALATTNSVKQGLFCPEGVFGQFVRFVPFGVPAGKPEGEMLVKVAPVLPCTE